MEKTLEILLNDGDIIYIPLKNDINITESLELFRNIFLFKKISNRYAVNVNINEDLTFKQLCAAKMDKKYLNLIKEELGEEYVSTIKI